MENGKLQHPKIENMSIVMYEQITKRKVATMFRIFSFSISRYSPLFHIFNFEESKSPPRSDRLALQRSCPYAKLPNTQTLQCYREHVGVIHHLQELPFYSPSRQCSFLWHGPRILSRHTMGSNKIGSPQTYSNKGTI